MKLTLPYPPSGNLYWRHVGPKVLVSKEARAYRTKAALLARSQGARVVEGPVSVSMFVFRPRRQGDLDNTLKVTLDALRGIAYQDDAQVVELWARRADDAANPRVEVVIRDAGYSE